VAKQVIANLWITYLTNVWWHFNIFKHGTFLVLTIPAVLHVGICTDWVWYECLAKWGTPNDFTHCMERGSYHNQRCQMFHPSVTFPL